MGKTVDTLVSDIEKVLVEGVNSPSDELLDKYAASFRELLETRLKREPREPVLRMSNVGKPCSRQLYYEINNPDESEQLRPETYMKFLFGDITELLLLYLVEASGHTVEGTQDTQNIEGVEGHRDAVIDGTIIDVKSASSFSFKKFKNHTLADDDSFGYIDQIGSYLHAGQDDPIVTDKNKAGFLVLDKVLGHVCLDLYEKTSKDYPAFVNERREIVNAKEPPPRGFDPIPEGQSGNEKLGVNCSYCSFKNKCHPNLRTFLYSYGPVHLTTVKREPKVLEITGKENVS